MYQLVLVAVGGGVGASIRQLVNMASLKLLGPNFPWATMLINISGSLAMGVFIELLARRSQGSNELRLFVATGVLGGFTTFSAFSLDFATLWERGDTGQATAYAAASVIVSLLALFAGLWAVRSLA
jgi:CrcB protein